MRFDTYRNFKLKKKQKWYISKLDYSFLVKSGIDIYNN